MQQDTIEEERNTANTVHHGRFGKVWKPIASAAVAALAALSMGLGANTALAAPTEISTYAHVDYVSVNYDADNDAIELGSNLEDTEWVPAGTYEIAVPWTTGASGTGYILPETKPEAEAGARNVPWVGFSGDESLRDIVSASAGDSVTVNLTKVTFTPKAGGSNAGAVTASQNGQTWFSAAGAATDLNVSAGSHTFAVTDTDDEVFHEHTKWVFSQSGTYALQFSAQTSNGYTAPAQEYIFKVGL